MMVFLSLPEIHPILNGLVQRGPIKWFAAKFPDAAAKYGCPFLEMRSSSCDGFSTINPVVLNTDFFAGMLAGDAKLGHCVVFNEADLTFYYREPLQNVFRPTTSEKLQNYYRAMMIRCAQELGGETDKLNLFAEFRSDKNARAVTTRAKSILACSPDFFSATSPHQRVKGPELHERLARVLVETMLEPREGACLTVTQAYDVFCRLGRQRNLGVLKRSMFRELMRDLVREHHGLSLCNDVPDAQNRQQQAWRGLVLTESATAEA
jgi:hypothetical protein